MFIYILLSYLYLCQDKKKNCIHLTMNERLCGNIILYIYVVFQPTQSISIHLLSLIKITAHNSNKNCFHGNSLF